MTFIDLPRWEVWEGIPELSRCLTQDKSPGNDKGFVSIETLCRAKTLDPTMQSVKDFVAAPNTSLTSPLDLAEEVK